MEDQTTITCDDCGQRRVRYWDDEGDPQQGLPAGYFYRCDFCDTKIPEPDSVAKQLREAGMPGLFDDQLEDSR